MPNRNEAKHVGLIAYRHPQCGGNIGEYFIRLPGPNAGLLGYLVKIFHQISVVHYRILNATRPCA